MAAGRKADYTSQVPSLWAADLFAEAENLTFWHQFEGPGGSVINRRDDLTKSAGDTIKFDIVLALTGAGSTGDTTLSDGNEEKMKFRQQSVSVDMWKHAVRWSDLAEALITHDMRSVAKSQLSKRLASKLDGDMFAELTGAGAAALPTQNKWFAGDASTRDTIDATDTLTLGDISDIKAFAQSELKIESLRMSGGEEYFGLVIHPYANLALKKNTTYQQAEREAGVRGRENPLFTGATAVWDGVIIYVNNRVPRSNNAAVTPVAVADNVFFGVNAACRGYARYPEWREQDFSYGEEAGVQTNVIHGQKLNVFDLSAAGDGSDNTAIGSMTLSTAAVAPSA